MIVIGGIVLILLVVYLAVIRTKKPTFIWSETYIESSDQPFGTSVLSDLLENYFPGKQFEKVNNDLSEKLTADTNVHKNYIFIGQYPFYTDSVFDLLKTFVSNGNDAFLALNQLPENLSSEILLQNNGGYTTQDTVYYIDNFGDSAFYLEENYAEDPYAFSTFSTSKIGLNFFDPDFKRDSSYTFQLEVAEEIVPYDWNYFLPAFQKSIVNYQALGSIYSLNFCDLIKVPYGSGNFYIHCNPIVFSNYFQIEENNIEYTSKVLSYLKPGDIIWDEYSKTTYNSEIENNETQQEGPLKFILSQTSLRWAWYTMLIALLLFILFRTKRMQQSIPVLEPNENKSLEFVQTIGRMYYIRKNHKQLAQQKIKLFLHFINEKYQLATHTQDEIFIQKLVMKSEISTSSIQSILKHAKYIDNTDDVTDNDLIELHKLLEYFYKNCK